MSPRPKLSLVSTIRERCRVCYTCVRECPAKAIRISSGQAEVLDERCIGCGNCVQVCSQQAKSVLDSTEQARALLASGARVAACLAPSFPAEFTEMSSETLVGMLRALGFESVHEVAFGADLVAAAYRRLLDAAPERRFIATTCPAVVSYVERFHPGLVPQLAPVVSPMIAMARALHQLHGPDLRLVFIGPCLAKKTEAVSAPVRGEVDCVLTFAELRRLFREAELTGRPVGPADFDPPHSGKGALFPLSHGMLQAAGISEDLVTSNVIAADGRSAFSDAIGEFENGDLGARLLEVLCCTGCVMGPGMTSRIPLFQRRTRIAAFVRDSLARRDPAALAQAYERHASVSLERDFMADDQRYVQPSDEEMARILAHMGKLDAQDELNCGACGYDTCREHARAIHRGLAESEMCLPYTIDQLRVTIRELAVSHEKLASAQEALVHSEKLASMGQLAAGIAHEVNNPLGVVLLYSHMLLDDTPAESPLRTDLSTIVEQTDRAKRIVAGLLNFARQNEVVVKPTDVRDLVRRCLKSVAVPESVQVDTAHEEGPVTAEMDGDQIAQVLVNLMSNAIAAMPGGGTLSVRTRAADGRIFFTVRDTGIGIPPENRRKIFTPFFTTKKAGQGTGLGLAVSYGIVKMHRGDIRVDSNADPAAGPTGTTFVVSLPDARSGETTPAGEGPGTHAA
jgi:signal transduction histidine kinase/NAD-dependent dihydropyrimidine dehydrogenase PreA subunit